MSKDLRSLLESGLSDLGLTFDEVQVKKLLQYSDLILKWNKTYNLTAIKTSEEVIVKHLLDSLSVCKILQNLAEKGNKKVLDVGCGAGLPSLPCSMFSPDLSFTLVDSVGKKIMFVTQVCTLLGLKHVFPKHERIEDEPRSNKFSVITSRAFTSLENFVELTRDLLEEDGRWLALKAKLEKNEISAIPDDIEIEEILDLKVPFLNETRCIVILKKKIFE